MLYISGEFHRVQGAFQNRNGRFNRQSRHGGVPHVWACGGGRGAAGHRAKAGGRSPSGPVPFRLWDMRFGGKASLPPPAQEPEARRTQSTTAGEQESFQALFFDNCNPCLGLCSKEII